MKCRAFRWTAGFLAALVPALAARAAVDYNTPAMRELRENYVKQGKQQAALRLEKLKALVEENLVAAREMLREAKVSGNITASAVARAAVSAFEECETALGKSGDFRLPENPRRELRARLAEAARKKEAIEETARQAAEDRELDSLERLKDLLAGQGMANLTRPQLQAMLKELLGAEGAAVDKPPAPPAPAGTDTNTTAGGEAPPSADPTDRPPTVIAASGEGTEWTIFARWYAAVNAMEVAEVPVMARRQTRDDREFSVLTGQNYVTRYEAVRELTPENAAAAVFRVKSIRFRHPAEVVEWPTARNRWTLVLRMRPGAELPSQHGVDLEVSFPGAAALPTMQGGDLAGLQAAERAAAQPPAEGAGGTPGGTGATTPGPGTPGPATPAAVNVTFRTTPPGAAVYVNGKHHRDPTPCTAALPVEPVEVVFRKIGYEDARLGPVTPSEGQVLEATLARELVLADRTTTVPAAGEWRHSGVPVRRGERITITAAGTWTCGAQGEPTDANGYPNDRRFFHYYRSPLSSPRQLPNVLYGALLGRIGTDGAIRPVGAAARFTADADGALYFDINESTDPRLRRDNTGLMTVRVIKTAPAGE